MGEPADPREPGAAGNAPRGLQARTTSDGASFVLKGPWQPTGQQQTTAVTVSRSQVALGLVQVPWSDVARAGLLMGERTPLLALLDSDDRVVAAAPCVGTADDEWLAHYLQAYVERRGLTAADRAAFDRDAADLRHLLAARDGGDT